MQCNFNEIDFTFHYVSILIRDAVCSSAPVIRLYIPLCLYFNLYTVQKERGISNLYIPLCLYFNRIDKVAQAVHATLHSIMSLF